MDLLAVLRNVAPGVSTDRAAHGVGVTPPRFTPLLLERLAGGHGVGWTEVERYKFKVPQGWEEVPVSIADLGGTEIDLR